MTLLNDYIVLGALGKGTYGSVKLCYSMQDDNLYALKGPPGTAWCCQLVTAQLDAPCRPSAARGGKRGMGVAEASRAAASQPASPPTRAARWPSQVLQKAQLKRQMLGPRPSSNNVPALDMLRCAGLSCRAGFWPQRSFGRSTLLAWAGPSCPDPWPHCLPWLALGRRREVDVMRSMNHPNLIKIFEVIEADSKVGWGRLPPARREPVRGQQPEARHRQACRLAELPAGRPLPSLRRWCWSRSMPRRGRCSR